MQDRSALDMPKETSDVLSQGELGAEAQSQLYTRTEEQFQSCLASNSQDLATHSGSSAELPPAMLWPGTSPTTSRFPTIEEDP